MAACVSSATSTVFTTALVTSTTTLPVLTTITTVDPTVVTVLTSLLTDPLGIITGTSLIPSTGATVTLTSTSLSTSVVTSTISSAVSTLFATCTTTSTTSTTSTTTSTTPTSTPTTSTTTSTAAGGGVTITQTTTVPPNTTSRSTSTSTSPTSLATGGSSNQGSSGAPIGAIVGGVVGGVVVLALLGICIRYMLARGSRKDKEKDMDFGFTGDDAWDPAVGVAGSDDRRLSRRRTNNGGGGGYATDAAYAAVGAGAGAAARRTSSRHQQTGMSQTNGYGAAIGHTRSKSHERRSNSLGPGKKLGPADEQDAYYSHAPPVAPPTPSEMSHASPPTVDGGMAGVGTAGRSSHEQGRQGRQSQQPVHTVYQDAYDGLEDPMAGGGGYAEAARLHNANRSAPNLHHQGGPGGYPQQSDYAPYPVAGAGYQQQSYSNGSLPTSRQPVQYGQGAHQVPEPTEGSQGRYLNSIQYTTAGGAPSTHSSNPSLPTYHTANEGNSSYSDLPAPNPRRFDAYDSGAGRSAPNNSNGLSVPASSGGPGWSSPAPSHRSIPALGAVARLNTSSDYESGDDRKAGPLRVVNEADDDYTPTSSGGMDRNMQAAQQLPPMTEEERRFGRRAAGPYDD